MKGRERDSENVLFLLALTTSSPTEVGWLAAALLKLCAAASTLGASGEIM